MCLIEAWASWMRGTKYVHDEVGEQPGAQAGEGGALEAASVRA